jgi:hypothetical protein
MNNFAALIKVKECCYENAKASHIDQNWINRVKEVVGYEARLKVYRVDKRRRDFLNNKNK